MIYSVLRQEFVTRAGVGNENTIQPLFKNLQKMPCNAEFFVQEYGANMPGAMPRTVDACVQRIKTNATKSAKSYYKK